MDITNRLGGKAALVTGGSRGIGAEIVRRLAAEGADVSFTYNTGHDAAQQVTAQVSGLGRRVLAVQADLAEPAAAGAVMNAAAGEFGAVDILVNNAGITHWGAVAQTVLSDIDRLMAVNARAPFLMMQAAAGALADGGRVVNISSGVTSTAVAGIALYSGVKAFLDQVTRVAAGGGGRRVRAGEEDRGAGRRGGRGGFSGLIRCQLHHGAGHLCGGRPARAHSHRWLTW
jgi:3-oxoacyl-[acyl-carrier protein] reductase